MDEGLSPDDLDRFGDDTGYCPHCGAEVWDEAPYCPECNEPLPDGASSRPPVEGEFRQRWFAMIAVLVLISFALAFVIALRYL